jgi:molybdate transport system permease protein
MKRTGVILSPWLFLLALPLVALVTLPLVALLVATPPLVLVRTLGRFEVAQALGLSLGTSLATTLLAIAGGFPLALLLARRSFRGRRVLLTLLDLPTVLPPSVAGLALLLTFGRRGLVGAPLDLLGIQVAFTVWAVILAQLFVSAPYFIKNALVGLAAVPRELEEAAALDGASVWQTTRLILLPLAWRGIVTGIALTWARALGEFGATLLFAGNRPGRTQTMPIAVYLGFEVRLELAVALAVILLAISWVVLALLHTIGPGAE